MANTNNTRVYKFTQGDFLFNSHYTRTSTLLTQSSTHARIKWLRIGTFVKRSKRSLKPLGETRIQPRITPVHPESTACPIP